MVWDKPRWWKFWYTLKEIEAQLQKKQPNGEWVWIFSNNRIKIQNWVSSTVWSLLWQKRKK